MFQQAAYNKTFRVILVFGFAISFFNTFSQNVTSRIKLNQCGFYPQGPKLAVITGDVSPGNFYITSTNLRDTFYTGSFSSEKQSAFSSTKTRLADFSSFTFRGSFVVLVPVVGHSYVFQIDDRVHHTAATAALKGFYYQRASMPLEEKYAGRWHRSAGHPDNVVYVHPSAASKERPSGTTISSLGGWYDAGDYNKYIVNSGITMGTLLSAYEDFNVYFRSLRTNIPESNDGVPDILNEVVYNLRWMLTMQDPNDGGVYHKCTNAVFDGMVMPGVTKAPRYVVKKGTAAALDLAAVTAQAARIFRNFKKEFAGLADSCLKASLKAWEWAEKNPSVEYDQNEFNKIYKPEITTGGYGDKKFSDEFTWAAAELFITTKDKKFFNQYLKNKTGIVSLPSWNNVEMLAHYSLLRFRNSLPGYTQNILTTIKEQVLVLADQFIAKVDSNAFHTIMGQSKRDFNWGSNAVAANQSIVLLNAYFISHDKKYLQNALSNLDYILGRNATGYCFLTATGSHQPCIRITGNRLQTGSLTRCLVYLPADLTRHSRINANTSSTNRKHPIRIPIVPMLPTK